MLLTAVSNDPINQQLLRDVENTSKKWQQSLLRQLSALHYLLQQFIMTISCRLFKSISYARKVLGESAWVTEGKYQSPEFVNKIIEIMVQKVLRSLSGTPFQTQDLSNHEQMVICLRWVFNDNQYEVFEDLIATTWLILWLFA